MFRGLIALALALAAVGPDHGECPDCPTPPVYLDWYFAGDSCADVNRDGVITQQDIFDFLEDWFTNCNG